MHTLKHIHKLCIPLEETQAIRSFIFFFLFSFFEWDNTDKTPLSIPLSTCKKKNTHRDPFSYNVHMQPDLSICLMQMFWTGC